MLNLKFPRSVSEILNKDLRCFLEGKMRRPFRIILTTECNGDLFVRARKMPSEDEAKVVRIIVYPLWLWRSWPVMGATVELGQKKSITPRGCLASLQRKRDKSKQRREHTTDNNMGALKV